MEFKVCIFLNKTKHEVRITLIFGWVEGPGAHKRDVGMRHTSLSPKVSIDQCCSLLLFSLLYFGSSLVLSPITLCGFGESYLTAWVTVCFQVPATVNPKRRYNMFRTGISWCIADSTFVFGCIRHVYLLPCKQIHIYFFYKVP